MDYEAEHRKLWDLIVRYLGCGINALPKNTQEIVDKVNGIRPVTDKE